MKRVAIVFAMLCCFLLSCPTYAESGQADQAVQPKKVVQPPNQPLVSAYGRGLCKLPNYKCIDVSDERDWARLFPNKLKREIAMRLNRTNVSLYYSKTLIVPKKWENLDYMSLSPLPYHRNTQGKRLLLVNLKVFAFGAYNRHGNLEFWGPATGGKTWCHDLNRSCKTLAGSFKIFRIQGPECKSSKYPVATKGGSPMPYCMHYFAGWAIHASDLVGFKHRSHGCIRLFEEDVKWLQHYFVKKGTRVLVIT